MGRLESSKRWALVSNINNKIALQLSSEYNAKEKYKSYLDEHCLYPMWYIDLGHFEKFRCKILGSEIKP